jgi:hypothetical protein
MVISDILNDFYRIFVQNISNFPKNTMTLLTIYGHYFKLSYLVLGNKKKIYHGVRYIEGFVNKSSAAALDSFANILLLLLNLANFIILV